MFESVEFLISHFHCCFYLLVVISIWSVEFLVVLSVSCIYISDNLIVVKCSSSAKFPSDLDLLLDVCYHAIHCLFSRFILKIRIVLHFLVQVFIKISLLIFTSFIICYVESLLSKNTPSKTLFFLILRFIMCNSC